MAVFLRVIAVVAAAVLPACTAHVGGTPVAGTTLPPEPEELTAESVFEDLTTVDPCSLTSPDVFDSFGDADFATPESLDYCTITVRTSDGEASISVGGLGARSEVPELQSKRVKDVDGGLWIGQYDDTPTYCAQMLVFPDGVTMEVLAAMFDGDTNTCPMVEAGMDRAVELFLGGGRRDPAAPVRRRPEAGGDPGRRERGPDRRPADGREPVSRPGRDGFLLGGDGTPPVPRRRFRIGGCVRAHAEGGRSTPPARRPEGWPRWCGRNCRVSSPSHA